MSIEMRSKLQKGVSHRLTGAAGELSATGSLVLQYSYGQDAWLSLWWS